MYERKKSTQKKATPVALSLRDSLVDSLFLAVRAYATSLLRSRSFDHPGQMPLKQPNSSARHKGGDQTTLTHLILMGIQVQPEDRNEFQQFLDSLDMFYQEETGNPAYELFLS